MRPWLAWTLTIVGGLAGGIALLALAIFIMVKMNG